MAFARILFSAMLAGLLVVDALADATETRERLRHRLEVLSAEELVAAGERLHAGALLQPFYVARGYEPVWLREDVPSVALLRLDEAIRAAWREGLEPEHYHLEALQSTLATVVAQPRARRDARLLVDLELLASDAFLTLARHYAGGRVDPVTVDPGWFLQRGDLELLSLLEALDVTDAAAAGQTLDALLPAQPEYDALRRRLALQREFDANGQWTPVASGPILREGDRDERVMALRGRLAELGDLAADAAEADDAARFDTALAAALRRFQERHGLDPDGVLGPRSLTALNVPPEARIAQLRVNMERWRWLPRDLGEEHILVNIAGFYMRVVAGGEEVMRQRVIVGRPYRRTPVFTGRMTYLVLNPSWEVPHSLAVRDQLPLIRQNPAYLEEMGFSVLQGWGAEERRVDPAGIDWAALGPRNFPYRLRQAPGPRNALGQAKFMFPNRHNVYLHDTPARGLFAKDERAASSGCIRVSDPMALAEWLLSGPGRPTVMERTRIEQTLASGRETTVRLGRALPVHLLYWTAWVEDDGRVHYVRDVYDRDAALLEALDRAPFTAL